MWLNPLKRMRNVKIMVVNDGIVQEIDIEEFTIDTNKNTRIDPSLLEKRNDYLRKINRGGLCVPTDLMFLATLHVHEFLEGILHDDELKKKLFSFKNARAVFIKCAADKLESCENTKSLWKAECSKGHKFRKFLKPISWTVFNMAGKNYAAELNSKIHAARKRKPKEDKTSADQRKVAKLSSANL